MSYLVYMKASDDAWERPLKERGPVIACKNDACCVFLCPCGGREVYINAPPHGIAFDDMGRLTLTGSVGSHPVSGPHECKIVHGEALHDLPANWCHFTVTEGRATMYDDAKCPGSTKPAGS